MLSHLSEQNDLDFSTDFLTGLHFLNFRRENFNWLWLRRILF